MAHEIEEYDVENDSWWILPNIKGFEFWDPVEVLSSI